MMKERPHRAIKHIWKLLEAERQRLLNRVALGKTTLANAEKLLTNEEVARLDHAWARRKVSHYKGALTRDRNRLAELEGTITGYEAILHHLDTRSG